LYLRKELDRILGAPRVLFTTAMEMLNQLLASQVYHSLVRKLRAYIEPALLVCDELDIWLSTSRPPPFIR
jgi:hypothetical protein